MLSTVVSRSRAGNFLPVSWLFAPFLFPFYLSLYLSSTQLGRESRLSSTFCASKTTGKSGRSTIERGGSRSLIETTWGEATNIYFGRSFNRPSTVKRSENLDSTLYCFLLLLFFLESNDRFRTDLLRFDFRPDSEENLPNHWIPRSRTP